MPRALKYPVALCVALLVCTGVAIAAIPDADGYTYICVNKSSGAIKAREKGADCARNETASRVVSTQAAIPNITTYVVREDFDIGPNGSHQFNIDCNGNDVATGGGFGTPGGTGEDVSDSRPFYDFQEPEPHLPTGWSVTIWNHNAGFGIGTQAYVVCQHTA
jgi:hypothetical protein